MDLVYYKVNKLLWRWSKKKGARIVREAKLSMEKAPPALSAPSTAVVRATPTPILKSPKPDPIFKMIDDLGKVADVFSRFKTWLDMPDPPKQPKLSKPATVRQGKIETVPPFDIQEIPSAMRKEHMPIAAKLMERWFAGRLNYSPTTADEAAEINQNGKPYPPDMYDTTTIKLDWILEFSRAKKKYDHLIVEAIHSPNAKAQLYKVLFPYKDNGFVDASAICGGDIASLHHHFRFQFESVDGTFSEKIALFLKNQEHGGVPDDLSGALGSFTFRAALGCARFYRDLGARRARAEVTGIWVYVKDNYTFTDNQGDRSQYLGHWSSDGVIVVPLDAVAATSTYIPYVESPIPVPYVGTPVATGKPTIKGSIYYPIHNSDFRQWAIKHNRGGDFVIYSDRRYIPIAPPIKVLL